MKLSIERVKYLQQLLKGLGIDYTNEQTQEAGIAIIRFAIAKQDCRNLSGEKKEDENGIIK